MRRSLLWMLARISLALALSGSINGLVHSVGSSQGRNPAQAQAVPQEVTVGAYVMHIHEINFKQNFFVVDFYLWFRWKDSDLRPPNKLTPPYKTFSLVDARDEKRTEPKILKMDDGSNLAYLRIVATLTNFWDVRKFPLDTYNFRIRIEEDDYEDDQRRYIADKEGSRADTRRLSKMDWRLEDARADIGIGKYRSNFGDIRLSGTETHYTRYILNMRLRREGKLLLVKLLLAAWVGVGISFLAFFIRPEFPPRLALGVGAIFAAVASEYVLNQALPETNVMTLADELHMLASLFILASIVQSTWSLCLAEKGATIQSKRLDRVCCWVFPIAFVLINAVAIRVNAMDNTPPASHVLPLPGAEACVKFNVQWSGDDIGAGIQDYTIYVSDNNGPFARWLTNTSNTSAVFTGQADHSYSFYSAARDLAANVERSKSSADATTTVRKGIICGTIDPPTPIGSRHK